MSRQIPNPPRVISPTPDPTDLSDTTTPDSTIRRSTRLQNKTRDALADSPDPESRARSRSRDDRSLRKRRLSGQAATATPTPTTTASGPTKRTTDLSIGAAGNDEEDTTARSNGHLAPPGRSTLASTLRNVSRSPSPLGLIPIHRSWRTFVHRHEIPRKALHVSIGFVTLYLYARGAQTAQIHPVLLTALVPIAATDALRHAWPPFNRVYVRTLGALMREAEVHDRYNGVIWYLLGAWAVLRACPKDVGVMAVVLLSWCDTAASTAGRAFGRYTPQVRRGKSVAGSAAAALVGAAAAALFWGVIGPAYAAPVGPAVNEGAHAFAFRGALAWPGSAGRAEEGGSVISGAPALGIVSVVAGLVASASEAVDLFGADDNLSIPLLCGAGLWGFLWVFGR